MVPSELTLPVLPKPRRSLGGLLVRRERWSPSGGGWILLLVALAAAFCGFMHGIHPFLAVSDGGAGDLMVVEGWIGPRRVREAAEAFRRGHYQCVVVVRDVDNTGDKWSSGRYSADYVAADLVQQGVPQDQVHTLFCPVVQKDRTYHSALAVREWLAESNIPVKLLDVVTVGCHSRRSRLLYSKAFGDAVKVAVIPIEDPAFDAAHWWRTSEGVRDVPFEFLAYLYARLLFTEHDTPSAPSAIRLTSPPERESLPTRSPNTNKSQSFGRDSDSNARSAGFQPAVAPNFIRQTVRSRRDPQIENLRYSRLKTCATNFRDPMVQRGL